MSKGSMTGIVHLTMYPRNPGNGNRRRSTIALTIKLGALPM
jgi:hypothetical protein